MLKHRKVLALLSGGLDSTLAVKIVKDQGVDLEAVHFTTPFCLCDKCAVNAVGEEMGVKVHHIFMSHVFLSSMFGGVMFFIGLHGAGGLIGGIVGVVIVRGLEVRRVIPFRNAR